MMFFFNQKNGFKMGYIERGFVLLWDWYEVCQVGPFYTTDTHRLELTKQPSCQNWSNAFDISKKTDLTSRGGLQSNASKISCVIASSWYTQESDEHKPDWLGFNRFSSNRKL